MSEAERILRLENAFATLSELAARSQEVGSRHAARLESLEESNRRIADANRDLAESNKRISETNRDLAESNRIVVEMIRRHDERLDDFHAAREESDQKVASLVDARVRAEDEMNKLRSVQDEIGQKIAALVDAQIRNEEAHNRGMDGLRASLAELAETVRQVAQAQKQLSESQAHTDRRLDGLIDIVRDLRNGRGGDGS
jgi:chromosome segregation ATPase